MPDYQQSLTINYNPLMHNPNCLITIELIAYQPAEKWHWMQREALIESISYSKKAVITHYWYTICFPDIDYSFELILLDSFDWLNTPLSAPDVKVKGEKGHYLLLVQGVESGGCKARLIHSADQINGAVALTMIKSLVQGKDPLSSGKTHGSPCNHISHN